MIKLDVGLPVPQTFNTYPLDVMAVGHSFFTAPRQGQSVYVLASSIRNCTNRPKRRGLAFAIRVVVEDGVKGVRCWRTR